jgi:hypothetical protein
MSFAAFLQTPGIAGFQYYFTLAGYKQQFKKP